MERGADGDFGGMGAVDSVCTSWYLTFAGILSGGAMHAPRTVGGRMIQLGFGWLITLMLASYTANLASLLVVTSTASPTITSYSAFVADSSAILCVSDLELWGDILPELQHRLRYSPDPVDDVSAGVCAGGAVSKQDLQLARSIGEACTVAELDILTTINLAMPVCPRVQTAVTEVMVSQMNKMRAHTMSMAPTSVCQPVTSAPTASLNENEMSGALVVSTTLKHSTSAVRTELTSIQNTIRSNPKLPLPLYPELPCPIGPRADCRMFPLPGRHPRHCIKHEGSS